MLSYSTNGRAHHDNNIIFRSNPNLRSNKRNSDTGINGPNSHRIWLPKHLRSRRTKLYLSSATNRSRCLYRTLLHQFGPFQGEKYCAKGAYKQPQSPNHWACRHWNEQAPELLQTTNKEASAQHLSPIFSFFLSLHILSNHKLKISPRSQHPFLLSQLKKMQQLMLMKSITRQLSYCKERRIHWQ
jgi:hypothetical protein